MRLLRGVLVGVTSIIILGFWQPSEGHATTPPSETATEPRLQNEEQLDKYAALSLTVRMFYQRAFESVIWAVPMLDVLWMRAEFERQGVTGDTLAFTGSPPTGKMEMLTWNNTTPYIAGNVSLTDGPLVLAVPAESDKAKLFGTVFNTWFQPIEDFGPNGGIDDGQGGMFVLLPPGFNGQLPSGFQPLHSNSHEITFLIRSIPTGKGDAGWRDAVDYLKTFKVYPLADANNPPPTPWFDLTAVDGYFHGTPSYDLRVFELIDRYIQTEPARIEDLVAHGMLREIGIEKGKEFIPDLRSKEILTLAAHDAEEFMRGELENARVFRQYWSDRAWGAIPLTAEVIRGGATWNFDNYQDYQGRALDLHYWGVAIPKRAFDAEGGGSTFYLMTGLDSKSEILDGSNTYQLHVPAAVPARDFWSLILYSTRTRSYTDSAKFGLSSLDDIVVNADGSVDLYIGPIAPEGKEANWLATKPGDGVFPTFRFYGPTKALVSKAWKLGDFELIE